MKKQTYDNVLPNTYIPILSKKTLYSILARLSKPSLVEFIHLWPKLTNTQPHIPANTSFTQHEFNAKVSRDAREFKKTIHKLHKKQIIDRIIYSYWYKGLNLLQLSQIDCQLMVDRPNSYVWGYSVVKDMHDQEVSVLLDPGKFLDQLALQLSKLYLSYVYVCRHPKFPMILVRIQVFDLQTNQITTGYNRARPHISSHRPYFFAIPLNSPHIIQSSGGDMIHNIVMEVMERSLPQNKNNLLKLHTPENQKPIKSLESMHILKGNSRFSNSLGSWMAYADNIVDMLPLEPTEKHKALAPIEPDNHDIDRLKRIANLRFKGSQSGKLKSEKLFDDNRKERKRKNTYYNVSDDEENQDDQENNVVSEFASIVPIQYSEFLIREKVNDERTSIKFKLSGTDVFAGLHELSVKTANPEEMIVNPEEIPSWLTGEEGASIGQIIDSKFYSN
ncbi:Central kinetochore subunit CHL4 [Spathaspora sp. JA1]|nr:Central kinetochore subunit CHL4 [Spathaspora sp. JA1]